MIHIGRDELLQWLQQHEPVSKYPEDILAFQKELHYLLQMMDFRPSSSSQQAYQSLDQSDQDVFSVFTQDERGNYATLDDSPGGQILSDQTIKIALKKLLDYDDDLVDKLFYGSIG